MKNEEAIDKFKHLCEFTKQNKEKFNKVDELIEIEETLINYIENESIPKEKVKELQSFYLGEANTRMLELVPTMNVVRNLEKLM